MVSAAAPATPDACPRGRQWDLDDVVGRLRAVREHWRASQQRNREFGGREFPSRERLRDIVGALRGALFPMRLGPPDLRQEGEDYYIGHTLDTALNELLDQVRLELRYANRHDTIDADIVDRRADAIVRRFAQALPAVRSTLDTDVQATFDGDPAAGSVDEVLLCYPGIAAMIHHRLAHELYRLGAPVTARIIAELAHGETGIDIHPGASIGAGVMIDHGTGVVIGETATIGERVRIYQAVTLGARRFPVGDDGLPTKGLPRHPQVEDDVVIYAGATLLGRIVIGRGATIGGNVWLTHGVPPGSHVTQASIRQESGDGAVTSARIPDPHSDPLPSPTP
ncbi:MAG: serine acetyltransferase [Burkholderiaceae bacterium]